MRGHIYLAKVVRLVVKVSLRGQGYACWDIWMFLVGVRVRENTYGS